MKPLQRKILEQLIAGCAEPLMVAGIDRPDWPVVLCNPAFEALVSSENPLKRPLADVVEELVGREIALEVSESVRSLQETTLPVEVAGREFLVVLRPLRLEADRDARFFVTYWRSGGHNVAAAGEHEAQQALIKAKRRIRDLSRDDPVSGLLNSNAFAEILEHDWAVAAREKSRLALVSFALDEFDQYIAVFGRHASDSCQRRVAQAIRRCLRRASDVAARIDGESGDRMVVLSHASERDRVADFAENIATAVRELGLHHPRSSVAKFVTVSYKLSIREAGADVRDAREFLAEVL